jgi:hypothetical protein
MGLNTGGMIFLILGWGIIIVLTFFSFGKVLRVEGQKKRQGNGNSQ